MWVGGGSDSERERACLFRGDTCPLRYSHSSPLQTALVVDYVDNCRSERFKTCVPTGYFTDAPILQLTERWARLSGSSRPCRTHRTISHPIAGGCRVRALSYSRPSATEHTVLARSMIMPPLNHTPSCRYSLHPRCLASSPRSDGVPGAVDDLTLAAPPRARATRQLRTNGQRTTTGR